MSRYNRDIAHGLFFQSAGKLADDYSTNSCSVKDNITVNRLELPRNVARYWVLAAFQYVSWLIALYYNNFLGRMDREDISVDRSLPSLSSAALTRVRGKIFLRSKSICNSRLNNLFNRRQTIANQPAAVLANAWGCGANMLLYGEFIGIVMN